MHIAHTRSLVYFPCGLPRTPPGVDSAVMVATGRSCVGDTRGLSLHRLRDEEGVCSEIRLRVSPT